MKVDTCYRKVILIKNRSLIDYGLKLLHSYCTLTSLTNLFLSAACCPTLQTNFFSFSTLNPISEQLKYKFISYKTRFRLPGDFRVLENNTAPYRNSLYHKFFNQMLMFGVFNFLDTSLQFHFFYFLLSKNIYSKIKTL